LLTVYNVVSTVDSPASQRMKSTPRQKEKVGHSSWLQSSVPQTDLQATFNAFVEYHKMDRGFPFGDHMYPARCIRLRDEAATYGDLAKESLFTQCPAIRVRNHKFNSSLLQTVPPYACPLELAVLEERLCLLVRISEKVGLDLLDPDAIGQRRAGDLNSCIHSGGAI
jgi:hypothetical protein